MNVPRFADGAVTGGVRLWLRAESLAVFMVSLLLYARLEGNWWLFAAIFLVPDLSMLGYLINPKLGGLAYNMVHSYFLPLGIAVTAIGGHRLGVVALLCIWIAHIGLDRLLGFGLKYPTAFARTHLGILGKTAN